MSGLQVIFLDVDGVLNSRRTEVALGGMPDKLTPEHLQLFDQVALQLLRGLCRVANLKIVLSSSWRTDHHFTKVAAAFDLPIIDATPSKWAPTAIRSHEIKAWLDNHVEVTHYAILDDDMDLLPEHRPHTVQTWYDDGLTWAPFMKLCDMFMVNPWDCKMPRKPQLAYRLLQSGEIIQRGDEVLADDTVNWLPLTGWEVGMPWGSNFVPMRRRTDVAQPVATQEEAA